MSRMKMILERPNRRAVDKPKRPAVAYLPPVLQRVTTPAASHKAALNQHGRERINRTAETVMAVIVANGAAVSRGHLQAVAPSGTMQAPPGHRIAGFIHSDGSAVGFHGEQAGVYLPAPSALEEFQSLIAESQNVLRQGISKTQAAQRIPITDSRAGQPSTTSSDTGGGLPKQLKSGIESLSGVSMEGVRVHYNSSKPKEINALAYAQGTDIHLAAGQEKHLPHEAWHVVQQAQRRVRPNMILDNKMGINLDAGLEREAEIMGSNALNMEDNSLAHPNRKPNCKTLREGKTVQGKFRMEHSTGESTEPTMDQVITWLKNGSFDFSSDSESMAAIRFLERSNDDYVFPYLHGQQLFVSLMRSVLPTVRFIEAIGDKKPAQPQIDQATRDAGLQLQAIVSAALRMAEKELGSDGSQQFLIRFFSTDADMQSKAFQNEIKNDEIMDRRKLIERASDHMVDGKTQNSPFVSFTEDLDALLKSIEGPENAAVKGIVKGSAVALYGNPKMESIARHPARFVGIFRCLRTNSITWKDIDDWGRFRADQSDKPRNYRKEREVVVYSPGEMPPPLVKMLNPFYTLYMELVARR